MEIKISKSSLQRWNAENPRTHPHSVHTKHRRKRKLDFTEIDSRFFFEFVESHARRKLYEYSLELKKHVTINKDFVV